MTHDDVELYNNLAMQNLNHIALQKCELCSR